MNFLFSWIVFSILFFIGVSPIGINSQFPTNTETRLVPTFEQARERGMIVTDGITLSPLSGSIAFKAWIQEGDMIRKINGVPVVKVEDVMNFSKQGIGGIFTLERSGQTLTLPIVPKDGKIGSYVGYHVKEVKTNFTYQVSFFESFSLWAKEVYEQSKLTLELLGNLSKKLFFPKNDQERKEATESLSWPIGVGGVFVDLAKIQVSLTVIAVIAALISINLWVFNLLPFPALDGGRFVFLSLSEIVKILTKWRVKTEKLEWIIHAFWFFLLMALSIFVAVNDILRFF